HYVKNKDENNYNGIYEKAHLNSYINNVFIRPFVPMLNNHTNDRRAVLINTKSSTISNQVEVRNGIESFYLSFNLFFPSNFEYDRDYEILIGWEFFDSEDNKLISENESKYTYSEWFNFYFKIYSISTNHLFSQEIQIPEDLKNKVVKIKFHIMNYDARPTELEIDNVSFYTDTENLLNRGDSTFDSD